MMVCRSPLVSCMHSYLFLWPRPIFRFTDVLENVVKAVTSRVNSELTWVFLLFLWCIQSEDVSVSLLTFLHRYRDAMNHVKIRDVLIKKGRISNCWNEWFFCACFENDSVLLCRCEGRRDINCFLLLFFWTSKDDSCLLHLKLCLLSELMHKMWTFNTRSSHLLSWKVLNGCYVGFSGAFFLQLYFNCLRLIPPCLESQGCHLIPLYYIFSSAYAP